jgi:hypothetical protein
VRSSVIVGVRSDSFPRSNRCDKVLRCRSGAMCRSRRAPNTIKRPSAGAVFLSSMTLTANSHPKSRCRTGPPRRRQRGLVTCCAVVSNSPFPACPQCSASRRGRTAHCGSPRMGSPWISYARSGASPPRASSPNSPFPRPTDCGLIINPDGLRNQIEANVIQGISRTLIEEVGFNGTGVTSSGPPRIRQPLRRRSTPAPTHMTGFSKSLLAARDAADVGGTQELHCLRADRGTRRRGRAHDGAHDGVAFGVYAHRKAYCHAIR